MTHFTIPVTRLMISPPTGQVITASELADYQAADDIIAQAHRQAEKILADANEDAEQLQNYCNEVRESVRKQELQLIEEQAPALRQEAVANTIQWLVEERNLERSIVFRLEERLRDILTQVFREFYGQQNGISLLVARLREHLDRLADEEAGTLYVNEQQFDELRQAFVSHPQLRIKPDARFEPGEAMLNTPLVSLYLNLNEQLQSILTRLEQLSQEAFSDQQD